ncbi:MAG: hypothetical protein H6822_00685 [Planctomycetaceae bacterium]|nr:hypothetical protein [Planctomycetales bacterium]MCB9920660.1 hypothetical protein [Planctomycetaceae bacterium]
MTSDGLTHLGKLTRLRILKIQFTKKLLNITTLAPLLTLQALEILELNSTTTSDAAVAELQALPRLKFLTLADSRITSTAMDSLAACPNLRGVFLDGNKLSADALRELANSPTLAVVSVTGRGLTPDEYLEVAQALPRITLVHPTLREHYAADIAAADWVAGVGNISGGYVPYLKKEFFIPLFQTDVRLTQANVPADELRQLAALKNITSLAIDAPGFTEEQVRTALESLRENPTLERMALSRCKLVHVHFLRNLLRRTCRGCCISL